MSDTTKDFALFVNSKLIGKTISSACAYDNGSVVQEVRIGFTDGTAVSICSEHDEGFIIDKCDPLGGGL